MKLDYQKTTYACFIGYIVQAIVNSFVPLLFVTFQKSYHIPLTQITLLITANFMIQLLIDLLSAGFIDKIGYRASVLIAHICAALGLILLTILPEIMQNPFMGSRFCVKCSWKYENGDLCRNHSICFFACWNICFVSKKEGNQINPSIKKGWQA